MNIDKLIEKGEDAHKKRNYDYAISIFLEAVSFEPDSRRAREGLRKAELKKHEHAYPSRFAVAVFGMGAKFGMLLAGLSRKKNPEGYMMACERFLAKDPKNKKVNVLLGDAAAEAGHLDAAIFAFETAAEHFPDDVTALKRLGHLLWRKGEIQRAHDVMDKAVRLAPNDQEAIKARKNLAAEASLKQTGFETAKSSRELVKDKDAAARLEAETRMYRTDADLAAERARLEERVAQEPDNADLLVDLAKTLQKMKDWAGAVVALDKAIAKRPGDTAIQFQRGDVVIARLEEEAYALQRAGKEAERKAKERELLQFRTEEYRRRVKVYPTDLNLRFRLGELLLDGGQIDEATAQFQQTVRDPKYKSESQLRLGRCFAMKGQSDLAERQLLQALEGQSGMTERVKEIHYALGEIYAQTGSVAKARQEFGKIYEVDINYRDVGERLARLQKSSEAAPGQGKLSVTD
ncbi:MAG: tetratricopeptide repeat protein [Planctomycetota bacterium]